MDIKNLTAVITSFKSEKKILNCIKSLGKDLDIIVIENSNDKKLKANKKRLKKIKETFKGGLIPKNSINDTFKDLHMAIHKLEHFINTEN